MLRAKIEELGLENDTIFLFTSDNGPHDETAVYGGTDPVPTAGVTSVGDVEIFNSNGPYKGVKQNIYEGGIREPFIAWGPGVLGPEMSGAVVEQPFATYDLLPTVADLVGIQPPADVDGVSLVPLLTGDRRADGSRLHLLGTFQRRRAEPHVVRVRSRQAGEVRASGAQGQVEADPVGSRLDGATAPSM